MSGRLDVFLEALEQDQPVSTGVLWIMMEHRNEGKHRPTGLLLYYTARVAVDTRCNTTHDVQLCSLYNVDVD